MYEPGIQMETQVMPIQTKLTTTGRTKENVPTQSQQIYHTNNNSKLPESAEAKHQDFPEQDPEDTRTLNREVKIHQDSKTHILRTHPRTL